MTLPQTERRMMRSRAANREYQIFVAKPDIEPPPAGYPVIYLLDANSVFGTMAEAVRLQSRRPEKTGVSPAVIVGIGYDTDGPFSNDRYYDFTMPVPAAELPQSPRGTDWPELGGADAFLKFIEEDLKPEIEREFRIDRGRQTIFGHSLGGLFVLHALFASPGSFQTYVAGSPSIHWGKSVLLEEERQFASRLEREPCSVGVLLAVGEHEKHHHSHMNDNAKELAERLSELASRGVRVRFHVFEGEGHVSVLPVLISRALRFASEGG